MLFRSIEGKSYQEIVKQSQEKWKELGISEHVLYYMQQGFNKKEAMKKVALDRGMTKREIYQALL